MREFEQRRRLGFGRFFTRDDLKRMAGSTLFDAMRTQWPIAGCPRALDPSVWGSDLGTSWRTGGNGAGCGIALSVDGLPPMSPMLAGDLPLAWVEAVEVYHRGRIPIQFGSPGGFDGGGILLVVWTGAETDDGR